MNMSRSRVTRTAFSLLATAAAAWAGTAQAQSATDFYKGKTINVIVGFAPGGGYDAYARLLARHLGQHIPGNPNVIVQNMPGAAGIVASNNVYNARAEGRHRDRRGGPEHSDGPDCSAARACATTSPR